jgi:hypothetical protein
MQNFKFLHVVKNREGVPLKGKKLMHSSHDHPVNEYECFYKTIRDW